MKECACCVSTKGCLDFGLDLRLQSLKFTVSLKLCNCRAKEDFDFKMTKQVSVRSKIVIQNFQEVENKRIRSYISLTGQDLLKQCLKL